MSKIAKKTDLEGSQICFLLEVFDLEATYRFSSFPISLFDGNIEYSFDGGLGDPEFQLSTKLTGLNIESESIPIELIFDGRDLVYDYLRGFDLEYLEAELSYCTVAKEEALQSYPDRVLLFSGRVSQPLIGDPSQPLGYAAFSLEEGRDLEAAPLIDPNRILRGDIPARGKIAPVVIGRPANRIPNEDGSSLNDLFSSPCYLLSTSSKQALIASHYVYATTVDIQDQDGNTRTGIPVTNESSVLTGNRARIVTSDGSGHSLTVGDGSDFQLWVSWNSGGGLINPFGGGELRGAGDVLRWALLHTNSKIDWMEFEAVAPYLNGYLIDGWLNEEVEALEWIEAALLPFLPVEIQAGPRGLYPILDLLEASTIQRPRAAIEDGVDFYLSSGLLPAGDPEDIINRLILQFGWSGSKDGYGGLIEIDPRVEAGEETAVKFSSAHSKISFNRFGIRTKTLTADFISDFKTASRVALDLVKRNSYPKIMIEARADMSWGYLDLGDLVEITSSRLHLSRELAQIVSKSYSAGGWNYVLRISSDPIARSRPT